MVPIAIMQTILANEYEFYNFVLKRLDEQLRYIEWVEKNKQWNTQIFKIVVCAIIQSSFAIPPIHKMNS